MSFAREMIETHPMHAEMEIGMLADCIDKCFECAQACLSCADACLAEDMVKDLVRCIRYNQDCADICETTGRLMSRLTEAITAPLRAQLESCVAACKVCGDECEMHGKMHEHCRICAEACRACEESCSKIVSMM